MRRSLLPCLLALLTVSPAALAGPSYRSADPPHVAVRFNPLSLAFGRTSGDVEVWVTKHVSVMGTMFRVSFDEQGGTRYVNQGDPNQYFETTASSELSLSGFELGARYAELSARSRYGQIGFFVGPLIGPAWGRWKTTPGSAGGVPTSDRITQLTLALEAGVLLRFGPLMANLGIGLQATHHFGPDPSVDCGIAYICVSTTDLFYGAGVRPRIVASVGFAF